MAYHLSIAFSSFMVYLSVTNSCLKHKTTVLALIKMMEKILKTKSKNGSHFENQLFEYNNFALHTQDDSCTLNALKMHLVFGLGVSAPA